jgi:hypothetical protein
MYKLLENYFILVKHDETDVAHLAVKLLKCAVGKNPYR